MTKSFIHLHLSHRQGCYFYAVNGKERCAINSPLFAEAVDDDKISEVVMFLAMHFGTNILSIDTIPCTMPKLLTRVMETHR